jgi:RNA polymerase primary sigma factor
MSPLLTHRTTIAGSAPKRRAPARSDTRLRPDAERRLVLAAQRSAGPERDQLVETFMPLISSIARLYRGSERVERSELMQEGIVGLLRALKRFDPALETPFWAYASWWVRQAMQQLMSELTRPVVLSDRAERQLAAINHARRDHLHAGRGSITLKSLTEATGLNDEQVAHLIAASRRARALDEPIGSVDGSGLTFCDQLPDVGASDAFERVEQQLVIEDLPELLVCLDEREEKIVRARYGLDGEPQTLREIGLTFGISDERVRQLESRAIEKLRGVALLGQARRGAARRAALARH